MQIYPQQQQAEEAWVSCDNSLTLPPALPTPDESKVLQKIMVDVNTYVDEVFNKAVMGQTPLDFDKFVQTLKNMGLDEAIKTQQAIIDRYYAKK